jgi:hypothetical protein
MALGAFGAWDPHLAAVYATALLALLVIAGVLFVQVVYASFLEAADPE